MKTIFALLLTLASVTAFASHFKEFTSEELAVTNQLFELCPSELGQAMGSGALITSAKYVGGMTADGAIATRWTVVLTKSEPAPSFHSSVSTLTINERISQWDGPAPADAPSTRRSVTCNIAE